MDNIKILTIPNLAAWLCFVWGLVVFLPFGDAFSKNPALFASMQNIVPNEMFWGGLFMTMGFIGGVLSYYNKHRATAMLMFAVPTSLAVFYFVADASQPNSWFWGSIGLANLLTIQGGKKWKMQP